jgi:hypothetical protein
MVPLQLLPYPHLVIPNSEGATESRGVHNKESTVS